MRERTKELGVSYKRMQTFVQEEEKKGGKVFPQRSAFDLDLSYK